MLLRTLEKSLKISVVKLVKLKIDSDTEYKSGVKKKIKEELNSFLNLEVSF